MPNEHIGYREAIQATSARAGVVTMLPSLATADQIGGVLQVSGRWVLKQEEKGVIRAALRVGKVVRFHPPDVAEALGLEYVPEFGVGRLAAPQGDELKEEVNETASSNGLTNDAIAESDC
jgi:hypothetical protein